MWWVVPALLFLVTSCENLKIQVDFRDPDSHGCVLGIPPSSQPRFSWSLAGCSSTHQTHFSISVIEENSQDFVWDLPFTKTNQSTNVQYLGTPLESNTAYVVNLHVRCQGSTLTGSVRFRTGLNDEDFTASWIGSNTINMNQIRREFFLSKPVKDATVFISGIGYYELFFNGRNVDPTRKLDPGWTTFETRVLYATFNVSSFLMNGWNAVGIALGNGWFSQDQYIPPSVPKPNYGPPRVIYELHITYVDGSKGLFPSDVNWKGREGPILRDSVYNGELVDLRRVNSNWTLPNFTDHTSAWLKAEIMSPPGGVLSPQRMEPIRVIEELTPVSIQGISLNVILVDFGQNFAGWARLRVKGPRGSSVTLRYAEIVQHPDEDPIYTNFLYTDNLRGADATDSFILSGDPDGEILEPSFTVHGFRYVEVRHSFSTPVMGDIVGVVVHSFTKNIGNFTSNSPVLNRIQHNVRWGQRSNLMSLPSDCPQRDERKGWMGDSALTIDEALFNFNLYAFYENWAQNIRDTQSNNGAVPDTVPLTFGSSPADPNWGTAYPTTIFYMYDHTGDKSFIHDHYVNIRAWVDFLTASVAGTGLDQMYYHYGDWVPPPPNPMCSSHLTSAAAYAIDVRNLAFLAGAIGKTADQDKYHKLYKEIGRAFHDAFYNPKVNGYDDGSQTANVLALAIHAVPYDLVDLVTQSLLANIAVHDNHLSTGIIGTRYLFPLLSDIGQHDLALEIATKTTYPSYGYMFNNPHENATTLWELWNADSGGPGMDSRNHIMFGSIGSWFYRYIAGINPNTLDTVLVTPHPVKNPAPHGVTRAFGSLETLKGLVEVSWELHQDRYELSALIPKNSNGEIRIPMIHAPYSSLSVNGMETDLVAPVQLDGVHSIDILENGSIRVMTEPGRFHFVAYF